MKRKLLTALYKTIYPLGLKMNDGGITILCYHSLDDHQTGISVAPQVFAEQMATLSAEKCPTFTMSEVADHLAHRRPFPPRAVAITFDDGFANVATVAAPIMAPYGFKATLYVIGGMVGQATQWTDHDQALPSLALANWEQLDAVQKSRFEIGAHTMTHGFLSQYAPDDLQRELVEGRDLLEQKLAAKVSAFAYPQGDYNAAVKDAVRAAGYRTAVTLDQGRAGLKADPLALPRLYVGNNTTPVTLRAFTTPSISPVYKVINLVIRGALGRKTWPGPPVGSVQSTVAVPLEALV